MDRFITVTKRSSSTCSSEKVTTQKKDKGTGNKENIEAVEVEESQSDVSDSYSHSDSDSNAEEPSRKNKKIDYNVNRKFKDDWKIKFKWLVKDAKSEKPFCKACNKIITGGITHIERHEKTNMHEINFKKSQNTPVIKNYFDGNREKSNNLVKSGELKLTMFLHEHNLPFILMDHLPDLLKSVCPDSQIAKQIKCGRTKATALTKECIAKQQLDQIVEKLRENFFSLIIETTDIGTEKSLALVVRFFDCGEWKDHFFGLLKVKSCTAEDLFKLITEYMEELQIPITKLIGFAADNASVMMGNLNGVQARFKQILPNIYVLGCICHTFHLCSSAGAKKLPRSLEDFIRSIYNYFAHSSKRMEKFVEFQTFLELKPHKLLHPSQTRWLSLQAAVNRVLENWNALILFFTDECFQDNLHSNQTILESLKNPIFKVYFNFLTYILEIVNKLNLEFQSEKPKLHLLLNRVQDLYRSILRNYIKKPYLDSISLKNVQPSNPRNFIELEQIYFGAKVELLLAEQNINQNDLHNFRLRALDFYIELCQQIKSRFNFDDPVLTYMRNFNPKIALSGDISSITIESSKLFPVLVDDVENLNTEWRLLADLSELKQYEENSVQEFWTKIFEIKNELGTFMFPNLTKLIKGVLSLPHSSACAERVFSQLNLLKTKTRNRLHVNTCDSILQAKELLSSTKDTCCTWQPSASLLKQKTVYKHV